MKFETYNPCDQLKPYISRYIIHEIDEAQTYKVLPDTGLVIGFQYRGRLSRLSGNDREPLHISGISGLQNRFSLFSNAPGIGTVLVFFREAGAAAFFRLPMHELFSQSLSLDHFMPPSALLLLEEQLQEAQSDAARIVVVETWLTGLLSGTPPDLMVASALSILHLHKGNIRIADVARRLYISQSPLEKRFRQIVGTSPKKFASIIRFQNLIRDYRPGIALTETGYDAGFYDQAHFIKEFRLFTGQAPEDFFSSKQ